MCCNFFVLAALCASSAQSIRRLPYAALKELKKIKPVSALNLTESLVSNQSETVNSTGVPHLPRLGEKFRQNYGDKKTDKGHLDKGICCGKDNRFKQRMYRWFYWETEDQKHENVWKCPDKWSAEDGWDCNSMPEYNKRVYKEDTDWVICCDKGEKNKFFYYGGDDCEKAKTKIGSWGSCTDLTCEEHNDVDEKDYPCKLGQEKKVNADATWACPTGKAKKSYKKGPPTLLKGKRPTHFPDLTDMQCAGYAEICAQNSCMKHSITKKTDCSEQCQSADAYNVEKQGVYVKGVKIYDKKVTQGDAKSGATQEYSKSGATLVAVNRFWLLLSIVAGAVLPALT